MKTRRSHASHSESPAFRLESKSSAEAAPVLQRVQASGRLDGVLFELTMRQTYLNAGARPLEVIYTFPLPHGAVLLSFASELAGQRKRGVIVAKPEAERRYEKALTEGDAPVMLEAGPDGLHTANIGNLKPGEEMVLEVRFAQLLAFEQGRLRIALPMTIAPRYGSADDADLEPQQEPTSSLTAEYPLALSVRIAGSLANARVECTTHTMRQVSTEEGLSLELAQRAWLDRDVVILVEPSQARASLAICSPDRLSEAAPFVVMAAFQPPMTAPRESIDLKLLVDCSGSMGGDSIASARVALRGVLDGLHKGDRVSLSRFGSRVEHVQTPTSCSGWILGRLKHKVGSIDADMGGTEMESALREVFALPVAQGSQGDVLMVTDGEIWQVQELVHAARASGHRVFAIGVGASPAEGVLRSLAEATGGACEFVTPGEALEAAAQRMLGRIRQEPQPEVNVDWGCTPVWQSAAPKGAFGGDTVFVFAGMAASPETLSIRLLARDRVGGTKVMAEARLEAELAIESLPRIAAARRLPRIENREALSLAVQYQLMSKQTNCILVHQRSDADKVTEEAELHRVQSMMAAGWGATGTVAFSQAATHDYSGLNTPSVWRSARSRAVAALDSLACNSLDSEWLPEFLMTASTPAPFNKSLHADARPKIAPSTLVRRTTLKEIALAVVGQLDAGAAVEALAAHCERLELAPHLKQTIEAAQKIGAVGGQAWLLLAHWVNGRDDGGLGDDATIALQPHLDGTPAGLIDACMDLFERELGRFECISWRLSRKARLHEALEKLQESAD